MQTMWRGVCPDSLTPAAQKLVKVGGVLRSQFHEAGEKLVYCPTVSYRTDSDSHPERF